MNEEAIQRFKDFVADLDNREPKSKRVAVEPKLLPPPKVEEPVVVAKFCKFCGLAFAPSDRPKCPDSLGRCVSYGEYIP